MAIGGATPSAVPDATFSVRLFGCDAATADEPSAETFFFFFVLFFSFATGRGDDSMTPSLPPAPFRGRPRPVEEEDGDEGVFVFFALLRLVFGEAGAGCVCVPCASSASPREDAGAVAAAAVVRSEWRPFSFFAGTEPADAGDRGPWARRAWGAALSEREASASATASGSAVGDTDTSRSAVATLALVFMRGTSTKSAVSDRGELGGEEEESMAEDDKDHTISSSSEGESVAHWSLELVMERMSIDDDKDVDIDDVKRSGGAVGRLFIVSGKGVGNHLSNSPIHQAISVPRNRNLLNFYPSSPYSSSQIPHDLGSSLR